VVRNIDGGSTSGSKHPGRFEGWFKTLRDLNDGAFDDDFLVLVKLLPTQGRAPVHVLLIKV